MLMFTFCSINLAVPFNSHGRNAESTESLLSFLEHVLKLNNSFSKPQTQKNNSKNDKRTMDFFLNKTMRAAVDSSSADVDLSCRRPTSLRYISSRRWENKIQFQYLTQCLSSIAVWMPLYPYLYMHF